MMVSDNKYGYFSLSDIPVASILRHLTVDTDCVGLDGIYKCLYAALNYQNPTLMGNLPKCVPIICFSLYNWKKSQHELPRSLCAHVLGC